MARKPYTSDRPRSSNVPRTGFEKMQMNHQRTRLLIRRIETEAAQRTATGKPVHPKIVAYRR